MLVAAVAIVLLAGLSARAGDVAGTPTVVDGETIEVAGRRFRLYGIDAPDPRQSCEIRGRTYACGNVARTALMDLVARVAVRCRPRAGAPEGMPFATCFAGGYDLSEGMVYTGWAMAMPRSGTKYARIERAAEKARRGLWQGEFVMPWAWRP